MDAIDNDGTDVDRLCDRIINGILHHPAQRNMGQDGVSEARNTMFNEVQTWWGELRNEQNSYRQKLSREGVRRGENHKEGVDDTGHGHGCTGKLKMRKLYGEPDTLENKIAGAAADAIFQGATGLISNVVEQQTGMKLPSGQVPHAHEEKKGGLEGFLSKAGSILGDAFGKSEDEGKSNRRNDNESYTGSQSSYGRQDSSYGQSQQSSTSRYGQSQQSSSQGYSQQSSGYGNGYDSHVGGRSEHRRRDDDEYGGRQESSYGRQESSYGGHGGHGRRDDDYGGSSGYGGREGSGYGRQQESGYGGQESSYGGREENYGGNSSHGRSHGRRNEGRDDEENEEYGRDNDNYSRRQPGGYGGESGY